MIFKSIFHHIKTWWYSLRLKWAMNRLGKAMAAQSRAVGKALIPSFQAFAALIDGIDLQD